MGIRSLSHNVRLVETDIWNNTLIQTVIIRVWFSKATFRDFWIYFAFKDVNTLYSLYYFVFKVTNVYLTPSNRTNRQITTYFKGYNYNELFYKWRNPLPWNRVAIIIECPLWTQYRSFYRYVVKCDTPNQISVESHLPWIWGGVLTPQTGSVNSVEAHQYRSSISIQSKSFPVTQNNSWLHSPWDSSLHMSSCPMQSLFARFIWTYHSILNQDRFW